MPVVDALMLAGAAKERYGKGGSMASRMWPVELVLRFLASPSRGLSTPSVSEPLYSSPSLFLWTSCLWLFTFYLFTYRCLTVFSGTRMPTDVSYAAAMEPRFRPWGCRSVSAHQCWLGSPATNRPCRT